MGIISLGTYLKNKGVEVKLYDLSFDRDLTGWKKQLEEFQPGLIGISALTICINPALEAAKLAKEVCPGAKIIFGGPHPTALPEQTLADACVDFVCQGEGELTLLELVHALDTGRDVREVKGLFLKRHGEAFFTGARPYAEDLDELGIPERELLPTFEKYLQLAPGFPYLMPWTYLIVGRGCPFNCSFCQPMLKKMFGQKVRMRSPEKVVEEMVYLVERYGVKSLYFADDTFVTNTNWVKNVCAGIKEKGINKKIVWMAQTNVNTLTDDMARSMHDAGCVFLAFGVESGNERILKEVMNKNQNREQIKTAFRICRDNGMLSEAALIIGCAEDSVETINDTVSLVREIDPDIVDLHYMTPTPGSELYSRYLDSQILEYKGWADPNRYTPGLLKLQNMSQEELLGMYDKVIEAYLYNKSIFRIKKHWFRWLWNLASSNRSPERFFKLFILQFLMLNSYNFNKLFKSLIRFKHRVEGRKD